MRVKLTYIYMLALVASVAYSCSSDVSRELGLGRKAEVVFDVSGASRASRASVTTSSDINTLGSKFMVFGDLLVPEKENGEPDNREPIVVLEKTVVEYKTDGWSYDEARYWFPNCEHSFVAVHPSSIFESIEPAYSGSGVSFTYELPLGEGNTVNKEDITDVISATHRRLYLEDDVENTVSFAFGHLLSLVNLSAAFDDNIMATTDYIEFHKLELSGFITQATFSIHPSSLQVNNQTDDREIDVTGHAGNGNLTFEFSEPVKVENNRAYVKLFADNDAILMLPQTFAADSDAKFILSYTVSNKPSEMKQVTLSLKDVAWTTGNAYSYKFTINRTGILMNNTEITNWDTLDIVNFDAR